MAQLDYSFKQHPKIPLPGIIETISSSGIDFAISDINPIIEINPIKQNEAFQRHEKDMRHMKETNPVKINNYEKQIQNMQPDSMKIKKKKRETKRTMFSDSQRAILLDWLRDHKSNPYPTIAEKKQLMKETGLNRDQVNVWFTNNRIRLGFTQSHSAKYNANSQKMSLRYSPVQMYKV